MSVEAITWANRQRVGSAGGKLVLLALANYADDEGRCWPSYRALAEVTEMSADSISRHIAALEARTLLEREARFDKNGRRTTNAVRLLMGGAVAGPSAPAVTAASGEGYPANCGGGYPAPAGGSYIEPSDRTLKRTYPPNPRGGWREFFQFRWGRD